MPDREIAPSIIQNSLASGEIAPGLWGRQDVAAVHNGAARMYNFLVDYKGGASTRPGTQFIGNPGSPGYARLIAFTFSADIGQTYMLVWSALKLRFIKNPSIGLTYPNSSNAGFIESAPGVPYEIATPYLEADLPYIKTSQVADQMRVTRHGYTRRILSRITDTNWTLLPIVPSVGPAAPVITAVTGTPLIAPDPGNTRYMYAVTAVDADGNESLGSAPFVSGPMLNIAISQGSVTVFWNGVAGAVFYRVYKALPTPGGVLPSPAEQLGFAGYSYGTQFTDSNIVPDFTLSPPQAQDPFANRAITGYVITATSANWPVGGTTITVTDGTGTGASVYPILDNNITGGVGAITGLYIARGGSNYTAPTLTAVGAGGTVFTATVTLSPAAGNDPDVTGIFQQRCVYASSTNHPITLWASRPGAFNDFRTSNPTVDGDAYTMTIASQQINDIVWLQSMPGGLVIASNSGIVQLNAGSGAATSSAVTASAGVIVPQSYYGAADVHPIVIDSDILYVQSEGAVVRDLQYNLYVNMYAGSDVTILSSHLFYPLEISDWAYQDTPHKTIWCARNDGALLSLTWLKPEKVSGWAQHGTLGAVEAIATVREGAEDAVYLSVNRAGNRSIERLCGRIYHQIDDAWCLDAALSTSPHYPSADIVLSGTTGPGVTVSASAPVFAPGDVGKVIRAINGKAVITAYTDPTHVTVTILYAGGPSVMGAGGWRMDPVVSVISGLDHLGGNVVYALADGLVQGPFTVTAGAITLTTPASQVVVGLPYYCQLQPLYLDPEGASIQGRLKRNVAATIRVKDAARLKFGPTFDTVREWLPELSTDLPDSLVSHAGSGMWTGNLRSYIAPLWDRTGAVCVTQDHPLPCTVTAIIPEATAGDA